MTKNTSFRLIAVLALVATSAFAQMYRPIDLQRVESMRSAAVQFHNGRMVEAMGGGGAPTQTGAKLLIWSNQKFYLPGEEIKIRAMGFASDANQLQIFVSEYFTNENGQAVSSDYYACDCGEGNGGYVPSLVGFNWVTLVSKKVATNRIGRYDFYFSVNKLPGSNLPSVPYQSTKVTVYTMVSSVRENNPIVIDSVQQVYGVGPIVVLIGQFPLNVPLHYFVGAVPYDGAFAPTPLAISTDGQTLVLPGVTGLRMEGRVVLELPDGSFSTTAPQTFVPLLNTVSTR